MTPPPLVPLSRGGNNVLTNITPLCEECHSKVH
ncbi:HNH endonuclease [Anoxybacteroides rupiense]